MNERFKELRIYLKMNQEEFGDKIGLSKSGISNIEHNIRSVTEKHIRLLQAAFNVNEDWIRYGRGEMFVVRTPEAEMAEYLDRILSKEYPQIEAIIKAYFRMSEEYQKAIDAFIDELTTII